ncbi:MAG: hypothetical protein U5N86_02855 [Planctomycetota bacterium]|nr:hypothetical protein [Planctomycetota bacterium]
MPHTTCTCCEAGSINEHRHFTAETVLFGFEDVETEGPGGCRRINGVPSEREHLIRGGGGEVVSGRGGVIACANCWTVGFHVFFPAVIANFSGGVCGLL